MAVVIIEKFDLEGTSGVDNPDEKIRYVVTGTEDRIAVDSIVAVTAPAIYRDMVQQSVHAVHVGAGVWNVEVSYGLWGETTQVWSTSGGTQHITQSITTPGAYPDLEPPDEPPIYGGAIGVSGDSVDGVDIVVPVLTLTETHYFSSAEVTPAYIKTVAALTGMTNAEAFRGYGVGEVLFTGADFNQRSTDKWEVPFRFSISLTQEDITVGRVPDAITGITKRGWDYLWVRYEESVSNGSLVKIPKFVYVEQVYMDGDFGLLGIGEGEAP